MAIALPGGLSIGNDAFGYAGAGSALLGGIVGAIGASNAAGAQSDADLAKARGFADNAAAVGDTAGNIWSAYGRDNQNADYRANTLIGRQTAGYAAANVAPGSGSPLDVLGDTEEQVKREAMNRFYTGTERGRAAGMQYGFDQDSAAAARQAAQQARDSASTSVFSSVLGGIGSAAGILSKFIAL